MLKTFRENRRLIKFILIFSCFPFFISCQGDAAQDASAFAGDAPALAEITRINQILATGQPLVAADFESLKRIYERYPKVREVRNVYQNALLKREDWISLEKFIREIPEDARSRDDRINLAKIYLKLGRYQDLIDLMKPLSEANPNDTDFNSLLSFGYFYLGQNDEAAKHLDAVWSQLVQEKRDEEITTRGMIYFRRKNYPKAIETLEKAIGINPQNATAANTLSRVYAAQDNSEKAEEYRKKTAEIHQKGEEAEARAMRNVQMIYELQTAWKEKKYYEVITLARNILPAADEKNKPALYQYIAESYKALGKEEEARAALAELENLKK